MRTLLALLAALCLAGTATAQTTNLNPAGGFGALHQYHGVTTDAVPDDLVTFYVSTNLWTQFASEAGTETASDNYYWNGAYAGSGNPSTLVRYFCSGPLINRGGYYSQDCTLTGESMVVTIYESSRVVKGSGSGRGGYARHTIWSLQGGTIVR